MILIGTMNLTRTRESGQFYCPECRGTQGYRLRARRPFLTLYFIPVVPIGSPQVFVVCDGCRQHWDSSVLTLDQQQHEAVGEQRFRDEALRAAILVVLADGYMSEAEIEALQQVANGVLNRPTDRDELGEMCSNALANKVSAKNYVMTASRSWSQEQRGVSLQAMFLAASAEGKLEGARIEMLAQMRDILELTEREYQSAIESALSQEQV